MSRNNFFENVFKDVIENESYVLFQERLKLRCQEDLRQKVWRKKVRIISYAALFLLIAGITFFYFMQQKEEKTFPSKQQTRLDQVIVFSPKEISEEKLVFSSKKIEIISTKTLGSKIQVSKILVSSDISFSKHLVVYSLPVKPIQEKIRVETLSDQELFAYFPLTPCALIPKSSEKRIFVFFHPKDEAFSAFQLP